MKKPIFIPVLLTTVYVGFLLYLTFAGAMDYPFTGPYAKFCSPHGIARATPCVFLDFFMGISSYFAAALFVGLYIGIGVIIVPLTALVLFFSFRYLYQWLVELVSQPFLRNMIVGFAALVPVVVLAPFSFVDPCGNAPAEFKDLCVKNGNQILVGDRIAVRGTVVEQSYECRYTLETPCHVVLSTNIGKIKAQYAYGSGQCKATIPANIETLTLSEMEAYGEMTELRTMNVCSSADFYIMSRAR